MRSQFQKCSHPGPACGQRSGRGRSVEPAADAGRASRSDAGTDVTRVPARARRRRRAAGARRAGYLLRRRPPGRRVHTAGDATEALRVLRDADVDAVFLDIRMPGLDGHGAGPGAAPVRRGRRRSCSSPRTTTAPSRRSTSAPSTTCCKPVRADRLAESLRRVVRSRLVPSHPPRPPAAQPTDDQTIPVELAGTHPDAAARRRCAGSRRRATTPGCTPPTASHLVRVPLATLAERWADAGFVRIHRSYLVAAAADIARAAADRLRVRRGRSATASCRSAAGTPAS